MEYDIAKLLAAIEFARLANGAFNCLDIETEPLSYTEPINKIILLLDDALEAIEELEEIMNKEA
jgi:hypothetical protein